MIITYSWALSLCFLQFVTSKESNPAKKDGKYLTCPDLPAISHGSVVEIDDHYVTLKCDTGYKLASDTNKFKCDHITGKWKDLDISALPKCLEHQSTITCSVPHFQHSVVTASSGSNGVQFCFNGFSIIQNKDRIKSLHVECNNNIWYYLGSSERVKDCFQDPDAVQCDAPPEIENAYIQDRDYLMAKFNEGYKVYYQCDSGYQPLMPNNYLTCHNGRWQGSLTYCEEVKGCGQPPDISHAKWRVSDSSYNPRLQYMSIPFPVGTRVEYTCMYSSYYSLYRLVGDPVIECQDNGQWTRHPACINSQGSNYCLLPVIDNGECICYRGEEECDKLTMGDKVECTCNTGYDIKGEEILTCQGSTWDHIVPKCQIQDTQDNTDSLSIDENGEQDRSHMNTLAIVVATACSVLGLLLLVMVAVVFRRRKPHHHHSRLYHQGVNAPPYQRVHNHHLEEHDRVALIGYESARLPTYEEATRSRSVAGVRSSPPGNDYRPLPNIPTNILNSVQSHNNNNNNNSNNNNLDNTSRHSLITTSTVNRDGVSEIFGSIDTVNFSTCASDASTSVTVDTLDSRTSRPSTSSGIATAGSLENVNSDDVPLLENTQQENEDVLNNTQPSTEDPEICSDHEDKEV